jgi:hypothetical protein
MFPILPLPTTKTLARRAKSSAARREEEKKRLAKCCPCTAERGILVEQTADMVSFDLYGREAKAKVMNSKKERSV